MKNKVTLEISRTDLAALVHWASCGVNYSVSGYKQKDIIEIIKFHRTRIRPTIPIPRWNSAIRECLKCGTPLPIKMVR
jgi:hypothetical protein